MMTATQKLNALVNARLMALQPFIADVRSECKGLAAGTALMTHHGVPSIEDAIHAEAAKRLRAAVVAA